MKYIELVDLYEAIGATTKRLEITRYIVDFLKKIPGRVIDKIVYLTQGKLYPDFAGVNVGIAEKTALKAKNRWNFLKRSLWYRMSMMLLIRLQEQPGREVWMLR